MTQLGAVEQRLGVPLGGGGAAEVVASCLSLRRKRIKFPSTNSEGL